MRISDWSSDVCCSDLDLHGDGPRGDPGRIRLEREPLPGTETPFADELEVAWQANRHYVVGRHGAHLAQSRSDAHDELELCLLAHPQTGRPPVRTPITNAHPVCRLLLPTKKRNPNTLL